jgi:serine/threonine protein kinase/Tol biopolymer transport system component
MTPDRWRDVTDLFHAAVARDPNARAAFLDDACRQDPSLRRSVESLLEAHDEASARGGTAALLPLEPSLQPGTIVGPYRVEALIDVGGMGEVYRAIDTQLQRPAALKVLSPDLADDPGFQARFEREARLLAALNHPAIAAIYGLEKTDERRVIAMEFVDGPTLADRLAGGRLPVPDALTIAIKIADALAAAHDKGIVHRDLKPSNIKISTAGAIKLLDFGIAKETASDGSERASQPTATSLTRQGAILGTAAYMSPEQARGGAVDKRSDIWAFGCVLFEMLAGRRAFDGHSTTDTLAKILEREPDWAQLPGSTPEAVRKLLRRCLSKDAGGRLRDIADARFELADAASDRDESEERRRDLGPRRSTARWTAIAALLVVASVGIWLLSRAVSRDQSPAQVVELGINMPPGVMMSINGAPISPDGRYVAVGVFKDTARILIYTLATAETRLLPGTEGGLFPFWSADGSSLGFFAQDKAIMRIDPDGLGPPIKVCDVPTGSQTATWNADGVILFSVRREIYRVAAAGGPPVKLDLGGLSGRAPSFVSDNRHFLFYDGPGHVIRMASLDGPETRAIVESDYPAVFAPPDQVLFIRGTSLMAQTLDMRTLALAGSPTIVAQHVAPGDLASNPFFSASRTGALAYAQPLGGLPGQLTWFDLNGRAGDVIAAPANTEYLNPSLSPDGQALAVNVMDPQSGNWDIWTIDLRQGTPQHQTTDVARDTDPVWSDDGQHIAFVSNRGGRLGLYQVDVDALGSDRLIRYLDPGVVITTDWSRDGHVLYTRLQPQMVWAVSTRDDSKPIEVLGKASSPYAGRVSPDGKWIAYAAFDSGSLEVYVEPFLATGRRTQITHEGGTQPRWSADAKKLFYWAVPGGVNVVDLSFDASGLHAGKPRSIVQAPVLGLTDFRTHYDVTRDGQRFLVRQPAGSPRPAVSIILNWTQRLKPVTKESR